jgi:ABC-type antimicrobial peptide transport system permease subunit
LVIHTHRDQGTHTRYIVAQSGVPIGAVDLPEGHRWAGGLLAPFPAFAAVPFAKLVGEQTHARRPGATVSVAFDVLALTLAAVGLYAVIAYDVEQRAHEVSVRVALGAERRAVVLHVVRRGVLLGGAGIALDAAVTLAVAGRVAPPLFDVSPRDPLVYALVAAAMLGVAIAASLVPARRAARVDPVVALRSE